MGSDERRNPFNSWKKDEQVSPTKAYDRNGRELQVGDVIHVLNKADIMWRLQKVAPVLDPKAPAGLVELHMVAVFVTGVQGGMPISDVIKTRDASEQPAVQPAQPGESIQ